MRWDSVLALPSSHNEGHAEVDNQIRTQKTAKPQNRDRLSALFWWRGLGLVIRLEEYCHVDPSARIRPPLFWREIGLRDADKSRLLLPQDHPELRYSGGGGGSWPEKVKWQARYGNSASMLSQNHATICIIQAGYPACPVFISISLENELIRQQSLDQSVNYVTSKPSHIFDP